MAWSSASGWNREEGSNKGAVATGGAVTLDPATAGAGGTLSGGNLTFTFGSAAASARSTTSHSSGKYYFEVTFGASMSTGFSEVGLANASQSMSSGQLGGSANSGGCGFGDFLFYISGSGTPDGNSFVPTNVAAGNLIGVAVDLTAGKIWGTKNGTTWTIGTGDPVAGTAGCVISALTGTGALFAAVHVEGNSNSVVTINFGPTYTYTKPTGYSDW